MNDNIEEVKKILGKHNYLPILQKREDGVLLKMPKTPLLRKSVDLRYKFYNIQRGLSSGIFYNSYLYPDEKFIPVPEYALRLFVIADVSACCSLIPISDQLISYIDEGGKEYRDIESIIASPMSEEDCTKEGFLIKLFISAREDNFSQSYEEIARTHNVYEGYQIIKTFFKV